MKKVYKTLTGDQIKRGVIFSSTLSITRTEKSTDKIHEVFYNDEDRREHIERLRDDKFFDGSPWKYNIIRQ